MNPLDNYKKQMQNKVLTASPGELTLMLYEGAIKFCNFAINAIERKEIEKAHNNIIRVQDIIFYLKDTLDTKYEVSKEFLKIYEYLEYHLIQANIKKSIDELNEVSKQLHILKETWGKVMKNS